jgi:phospholipid transport system substrate-binding protein
MLTAASVTSTTASAGSAIEVEASSSRSLDAAKQFIMDLAQQSMIALQTPDKSSPQRQTEFRELWRDGVAFKTTSRFVLGRYWRSATPEQRERYQELFVDSVMRTSETVLSNFDDDELIVTDTRLAGKKDILVSTKLIHSKGPAVPVDWRVRIIDDRYQVIDVAIEGVSMALTKRSEYSSVVKNRGMEGLLTALQPNI